jgi:hypothetical protein
MFELDALDQFTLACFFKFADYFTLLEFGELFPFDSIRITPYNIVDSRFLYHVKAGSHND